MDVEAVDRLSEKLVMVRKSDGEKARWERQRGGFILEI